MLGGFNKHPTATVGRELKVRKRRLGYQGSDYGKEFQRKDGRRHIETQREKGVEG